MIDAPVLLDFESRSRADLKRVGGRRYWEHPSSEALCVVWYDTRDESVGVWFPGDAWPHAGRVLAAHNAHGFDRFAADRYGFAASDWIDTAQLARKAGLPGSLDALGLRWCGVPKDKVASQFTRGLSTVRRPSKKHGAACIPADEWNALSTADKRERGVLPDVTAEALDRVVRYCASDVAILAEAWPRLAEWIDVDAEAEALDRTVNDRGVCFDATLARILLAHDARHARDAIATAAAAMALPEDAVESAAKSPAQFCAIVGTPDAQAATIEDCDHPLAVARRALASIARGKLVAGLERAHTDGRLRDTLRYYGGHTGRWSGKGMQLQNLPRPAKRFEDVDFDALAASVIAGTRSCSAEDVAALVRSCICASPGNVLAVCDYSSIEARATAWAAGDHAALDVFRSGRDPYRVAACAVFGVEYADVTSAQRQVGKVCELALGYGGGPNAFEKMARLYRIDLTSLDLREIVDSWRLLHAPIRDLWYACERAFRDACRGHVARVSVLEYVRSDDGDAIACFLPSGRPIVYNNARATDEGIEYLGARSREHLYGGKLVENAVQALCRDLLAHALGCVERAGLNPVLTVHDEIVCDVPEARGAVAYEQLRDLMLATPTWAAGLPVDAKGYVAKRYKKG